ncbi:nuclear transport factor 2 family protein, partial [Sphingomonas asaccharolytica]|uniref:nuclear transport factor 2 family protein n=1 Tax=Sphingomonas asaccharolytica TaxID=40681 RepID=UPI000A007AF8
PANPLPPPVSEEGQVMAPINAMFDGLARRDSAIILASMRPDGTATSAGEKPDGTRNVRHMTAAEFVAAIKPGPERYEERISDPAIEIDGDIAMVWAPYTFLIDGKVHHCGIDHFDLVRENGKWLVQNITWSSRTTGCPAA